MIENLIYDTSLLSHATLTTLIEKGHIWRGPLCFDDILHTFKLFYTYVTCNIYGNLSILWVSKFLFYVDSPSDKRFLQFRYISDYSGDENIWGTVEAYKRLLGLVVFIQCGIKDDLRPALENFFSNLVISLINLSFRLTNFHVEYINFLPILNR